MSTVDNTNIVGTKTGPQLVTEIATQIGNTDTELDARPQKAVAETITQRWTFSAGITSGGNIISSATVLGIRLSTSDGADNGEIQMSGGGAWGVERGAGLRLYGNEAASAGHALLTTGDVAAAELKLNARNASGFITFYTNNLERARIDASGNWTITGTMDGRDIAADGSKLDGIQASAKANLSNLLDVDLAGRANTYIIQWDTTSSKYIHVPKPSGAGATNLSYSRTTTSVTVISDTGTNATIPEADGSGAGVMSRDQHNQLDTATSNIATHESEITTLQGQMTTVSSDLSNEVAVSVKDSDFSSTGICVRTGAGAYANRSIQSSNGDVTVTNGTGQSDNPNLAVAGIGGKKVTIASGAPGSPSVGDIWIDIS